MRVALVREFRVAVAVVAAAVVAVPMKVTRMGCPV
jgi:hypothetical protein